MTTIQNAVIFDELCNCCEMLTPDKLAKLQTTLFDFGLIEAAEVVRQYGIANCGDTEYNGIVASVNEIVDRGPQWPANEPW